MFDAILIFISDVLEAFFLIIEAPVTNFEEFILKFIPFALFLEFPLYVLIMIGATLHLMREKIFQGKKENHFYPSVSCIVLCYSEGLAVQQTIRTLTEQLYEGPVEILAIMDGATQNKRTYDAAKAMEPFVRKFSNRRLRVIPKWQRGGRVSSMNLGMTLSSGQIVMALDGDTSFDNDMIYHAVRPFRDENVVSVAGNLRVRNAFESVCTRMQAIEYLLSIYLGKAGLSEFNVVNNVSGAFGVHRRSFLKQVGGWDSGTAEDLDLTIRIKGYLGRYPNLRIRFAPRAIGHTDAPSSFYQLVQQRLRWDGDLYYLYFKKHGPRIAPRLLGWRNFSMVFWTGFLFQIVMPFLIILYTVFCLFYYPLALVTALCLFLYLVYFLIASGMFFFFLLFFSERKREDARLISWLPVFPVYTFFVRVVSAVATLFEIVHNSHLDSSMAPWWVLRKTKF